MTTHEQVEMAKRMNADGIDWWPYRIPLTELMLGTILTDDLPHIRSCHMSFRGETVTSTLGALLKLHIREAAFGAAIMGLMPYYYRSFSTLVKLNSLMKHPIPSVIYPHRWWEGHTVYPNFNKLAEPLVQPSNEMVEHWGVNTLENFVSYANIYGVKFCLDLFHMNFIKKPDGINALAGWEEMLGALMPHTKLIHLGAGRPDFLKEQNDAGIDSMMWLKDLIQPYPRSRIWDMLWWIKSHGYGHIPIVLEIPSSGIYEMSPSKAQSRFLSKAEYEQIMRKIIQNIRQFMS